ncbi:type I-B CRISPR-associated protein Cas5 [Candidatus Viridilinea mediisalina]|uniref:Type I-B CRISPR-associated protein Cas5 n=2 Tax=Candidatus Viridilinea mediisalina TaxID=2024553 RepID=A0A2A6RNP0_9CHLR|nr:type I-B CRISPR-associated protein Cas5 [Candidatus Viridilinea mediisalina]
MRVLKVVLEGTTTSFRYPHFMLSVHPSFPLPPPATIYGHICSVMGEWVAPEGLQFAYHFTAQGIGEDLEHIHVLTAATGKLPGTKLPKVIEGNVNPLTRQILLHPRLVLYLNRPDWVEHFRHPRYPVLLGRSQDLACYTRVEVVELEQRPEVYFEHTLLPYRVATQTAVGVVALMPRWLDYEQQRQPSFARYLLLQQRVRSRDFKQFGAAEQPRFWADPRAMQSKGVPLGLWFHSFTGAEDEALSLA